MNNLNEVTPSRTIAPISSSTGGGTSVAIMWNA